MILLIRRMTVSYFEIFSFPLGLPFSLAENTSGVKFHFLRPPYSLFVVPFLSSVRGVSLSPSCNSFTSFTSLLFGTVRAFFFLLTSCYVSPTSSTSPYLLPFSLSTSPFHPPRLAWLTPCVVRYRIFPLISLHPPQWFHVVPPPCPYTTRIYSA